MAKPFRGVINVDVTQFVPDWEPYTQPIAPEGTPSVLYIVLDDVGYSAMGLPILRRVLIETGLETTSTGYIIAHKREPINDFY